MTLTATTWNLENLFGSARRPAPRPPPRMGRSSMRSRGRATSSGRMYSRSTRGPSARSRKTISSNTQAQMGVARWRPGHLRRGHLGSCIKAHLKSKLLTFPPHRFNPHDQGERARYAAYALYRRAAETATFGCG